MSMTLDSGQDETLRGFLLHSQLGESKAYYLGKHVNPKLIIEAGVLKKIDKEVVEISDLEKALGTKLNTDERVSQCFTDAGEVRKYPKLGPREYLVACLNNSQKAYYGVFDKNCMIKMCEAWGWENIKWKVLEIPKALHKELLKGIDVEKRIVFQYVDPEKYKDLPEKDKKPYMPFGKWMHSFQRVPKPS